jgi:hypothetical protein
MSNIRQINVARELKRQKKRREFTRRIFWWLIAFAIAFFAAKHVANTNQNSSTITSS